ncbi:uncharacterized protein [Neodiprion pinetum]|uniref:uncharacterized protein n=1 Tax=Neodiprion pinetum TaxID=441929 RepID=UPI001EDEBA1B|nr:uncharacterized protein LOC124215455 [Neodiprion pinetum]
MRELLVTITLLFVVSSEEFEIKKRAEIPPEVDPNFWPVRGKRSHWNIGVPHYFSSLSQQRPEVDFLGYSKAMKTVRPWPGSGTFLLDQGELAFSDNWRSGLCPRKKSISLIVPLRDWQPDGCDGVSGCGEGCGRFSVSRSRDRRNDEQPRIDEPLYAEEPRWIEIDYKRHELERSAGNEEPFFVARGKKGDDRRDSDCRRRRQLEEVFGSYDEEPFFVARGKREVVEEEKDEAGLRVKPISKMTGENKFNYQLNRAYAKNGPSARKRPGNSQEDEKKAGNFGGKSPPKNSGSRANGKQKEPVSSVQSGLLDDQEGIHRLSKRSSDPNEAPVFHGDDEKWRNNVQSRYSRPRDKHSNLQSILEEPFFISRGKKDGGDEYLYDAGEELPVRTTPSEEERAAIDAILKIYRGLKTSSLFYTGGGFELSGMLGERGFEPAKAKKSEQDKPPRNRRGMLDDLLKSDDPFYVTRGKRLFGRLEPSDFSPPRQSLETIRREPYNNRENSGSSGKFSLFAKTTRTKLLSKLSDFARPNFRNFTSVTLSDRN